MARRVLIVSTVEHGDDVLRAHVGEADEVKVVVPVVRQGAFDWLANDKRPLGMPSGLLSVRRSASWRDCRDGGREANVGLAIRDALATFPADEIVVAVRPSDEEGLVESVATDSAPQRAVEGVPVRFVVDSRTQLGRRERSVKCSHSLWLCTCTAALRGKMLEA